MSALDWSQCPAVESIPGKGAALGCSKISVCPLPPCLVPGVWFECKILSTWLDDPHEVAEPDGSQQELPMVVQLNYAARLGK